MDEVAMNSRETSPEDSMYWPRLLMGLTRILVPGPPLLHLELSSKALNNLVAYAKDYSAQVSKRMQQPTEHLETIEEVLMQIRGNENLSKKALLDNIQSRAYLYAIEAALGSRHKFERNIPSMSTFNNQWNLFQAQLNNERKTLKNLSYHQGHIKYVKIPKLSKVKQIILSCWLIRHEWYRAVLLLMTGWPEDLPVEVRDKLIDNISNRLGVRQSRGKLKHSNIAKMYSRARKCFDANCHILEMQRHLEIPNAVWESLVEIAEIDRLYMLELKMRF